jgi:hypothetical protein
MGILFQRDFWFRDSQIGYIYVEMKDKSLHYRIQFVKSMNQLNNIGGELKETIHSEDAHITER